jgi:hypothetical protein
MFRRLWRSQMSTRSNWRYVYFDYFLLNGHVVSQTPRSTKLELDIETVRSPQCTQFNSDLQQAEAYYPKFEAGTSDAKSTLSNKVLTMICRDERRKQTNSNRAVYPQSNFLQCRKRRSEMRHRDMADAFFFSRQLHRFSWSPLLAWTVWLAGVGLAFCAGIITRLCYGRKVETQLHCLLSRQLISGLLGYCDFAYIPKPLNIASWPQTFISNNPSE